MHSDALHAEQEGTNRLKASQHIENNQLDYKFYNNNSTSYGFNETNFWMINDICIHVHMYVCK